MRNKSSLICLIIFLFFYSALLFPQNNNSFTNLPYSKIKLENLSLLKDKIIQYHSSGRYNKAMQIICRNAWNIIKKIKPASNFTVVFDVDETSLSNYSFLKTMDFGYIPFL